jgi:hypothetical protein
MNSIGKSEANDISEPNQIPDDGTTGRRSPILIAGLVGVLLICLIIGIQAFGILFSIVFPPFPPLPESVIEVRHTPVDHGVDEWVYQTQQNACDVVQYYEEAGGLCSFPSGSCQDESPDDIRLITSGQHVATCVGESQFNIFAYRWEANIADSYQSDDGGTQFGLIREVFWTGAVPPRFDPRQGFPIDD